MEKRNVPQWLLRVRVSQEDQRGQEGDLPRSSQTRSQLEDQGRADEVGRQGDQVIPDRILTESARLKPHDEISQGPVPVVRLRNEERYDVVR